MSVSVFDSQTMQHLWSTPELRAIFEERNRLQKWLDFEVALAQTQSELAIIPSTAADAITAAASVDRLDLAAVAEETRRIKHTLVPVLKELQKHLSNEAAQCLHYGATTQDVVDTGLVLQLKEAHQVFKTELARVGNELLRLAAEHRDTVMVGRTHGVQALPITFGHKCAIWLDELSRHAQRLKQCEPRVFVSMVVGAVGTQASYGESARAVEQGIGERLGLEQADISWAPSRDRLAEYVSNLAMLAATLGKIGNELFNLQRNEFAEVEEGFTEGKLGSSTMPHKRNPTGAENVAMLARSVRANAGLMLEAMVQEHERDGIAWKSEWKVIPEVCLVTGAMLTQAANLLGSLRVDSKAMTRNINMMDGYLLSEKVMLELGAEVGKNTAHEWLYEASMKGIEGGMSFADALADHAEISRIFSSAEIARMTMPSEYLGEVAASVDRIVTRERQSEWLGLRD